MQKQEDKSFYKWHNYVNIPRWCSYWHQINEVTKLEPSTLLIIGPGDNIIKSVLQSNGSSINIKTLDIADDLAPDFLGSVSDISKITQEKFDCILCSQVLEHLPWEMFNTCLNELSQSSNKYVIISLPQKYLEFSIRLVGFSVEIVKMNYILSFVKWYKKFISPTYYGHYWEIGATKKTSKTEVASAIGKYFKIMRVFDVKEYPYHRFFILEKK